jgi:FAD/FMN-containing dehydrogenase
MTIETRSESTDLSALARSLKATCGDIVHVPGDPGYDAARTPWNVAIDQRPAAVAVPRTAAEVAAVVRAAAALDLRVAPQGTGHGAAPLAGRSLADVVLLRTTELTDVRIDADAGTVRVGSGTIWQDVVEAAAPHGLAVLHGSSPDVGVAGYALGGGIGWYSRKHGLTANSITAVEIVTADGALVRADAENHPDLFWAVRGGGGSFGVVTALELRLLPITNAYAGMLLWELEHAEPVLREWADWAATAPDEVTTSFRVMRFPPMPELPDFLRGREVVVIDGAVLGDDAFGEAQLARLRALHPEMDTFARVPAASLSRLHMDPEGPTPAVGGSAMLAALDDAAISAFLEAVGPGATTSLLFGELRQLGGALARSAEGGGAVSRLDAAFVAFFVAIAATPELAAAGEASTDRALAALAPHLTGGQYLNFSERAVDPSTGYDASAWERLRAVRASVDPAGVMAANHPIG